MNIWIRRGIGIIIAVCISITCVIYYSQTQWVNTGGGRGGVPTSRGWLTSGTDKTYLTPKMRMDYDIYVYQGGCRIEYYNEKNELVYSEEIYDRAEISIYFTDFEPGFYYHKIVAADAESDVSYSYHLLYNRSNYEQLLFRMFGIEYWKK